MALGTSNRDGGKTSESGHLRALGKGFTGDVLTGLNVSQRAAGANMSVDVAIGDAFLRRSDGTYSHPVFNDAVLNKTITAADPSNPRRDLVVMYLDYGVTPSTAVSNNVNGVVAIMVVDGTAAGSPVDPNGAAVQAAVGSGNPYTILARVRVGAGVTTISDSVIDDLRTMASAVIADEAITPLQWTNPYKFRVRKSTTQSISGSGTWSKITFNTEDYDTGNNFDNATNYRFTAPVAGYYFFSASVQSGQGSGNNAFRSALYKNGTVISQGAYLTTNNPTSQVVDTIQLAAGDYVEVFGYNSAAGSININATTETYFSGHLVSR